MRLKKFLPYIITSQKPKHTHTPCIDSDYLRLQLDAILSCPSIRRQRYPPFAKHKVRHPVPDLTNSKRTIIIGNKR